MDTQEEIEILRDAETLKNFRLKESKHFCMAPWVTTYLTVEGEVQACCEGSCVPPPTVPMIRLGSVTDT